MALLAWLFGGIAVFVELVFLVSISRLVDPGLALDRERIESRINRLREEGRVPSYSVGIVQGDDLVYAESFGVVVGSLSKVFAATLFGILQEEGAVRLDEPVRSYLPEDRSFPSLEDKL